MDLFEAQYPSMSVPLANQTWGRASEFARSPVIGLWIWRGRKCYSTSFHEVPVTLSDRTFRELGCGAVFLAATYHTTQSLLGTVWCGMWHVWCGMWYVVCIYT